MKACMADSDYCQHKRRKSYIQALMLKRLDRIALVVEIEAWRIQGQK